MEYLKFIGGLLLLIISGKYLVQGGVSVAKHFRISTLIVGLTVVAFGTSAPELIVSINAAISGNPEIAFGNVVGSNIVNIAFILAATAIIIPIPVNKTLVKFDWPVMMFASVLLYVFILDDKLGFYEGLFLFVSLVSYIVYMILNSRKDPALDEEVEHIKQMGLGLSILIILASSLGLAFGADFMVEGASQIASSLGVSKRVISLTIVAVGTSAPELTASIIAAFKKEPDIAIGNVIGSNIFNIFWVLGISSMISAISIDHIAFSFDIICMLIVSVLLFLFIFPFKTVYLNRIEGMLLLVTYITYITMLLLGLDFESVSIAVSQYLLS